MKRCGRLLLRWSLSALAVSSFPTSLASQWPSGLAVEETPHNLRVPASNTDPDMAGLIEDFGQVCTYCHAPHGGQTDRPLWNRFTPSGPYRMYDDPLDMIADPQPTMIVFSEGEVAGRVTGALSKGALLQEIDGFLTSP